MSDLAKRDPRKTLSKSFMQTSCGEKAWLDIFQPLPWTPNEAVVFGSAVDAGCSIIIASIRSGQAPDMDVALVAAAEQMQQHPDIEVDREGVQDAIEAFLAIPFDWTFAKVGMRAYGAEPFTMRLELDGVGMVDAHPDVILRDHSVWDIKTSKRSKPEDAAAKSITELAFYGICYEAFTGERVPEVGYLTWVRTKNPYWQQVAAPFTDDMRAAAYEEARTWAGAIRLAQEERNYTFPFGPKYGCEGCQYHPALGGPCRKAQQLREAA